MTERTLPNSLWAATAAPAPETHPLTEAISADVAIVGAGYAGLRTALELASAGTNVCVIDAGDIGWGASGRSGGQVNPIGHEAPAVVASRWRVPMEHEQVQRYIRFTTGAADELFHLVRRWNIDCDAEQNGWIRGVHGTRAKADFYQLFEGWQATGTPMRLIDRDELEQLSGARGYLMGWIAERGGSVQPLSYVRGLAHAAIVTGARVYTHTRAASLRRHASRWRLDTARGTIDADQVVLCTNAYTDELFKGLRESVVPVTSAQAATAPLSDNQIATILPRRHTFADTRRVICYFRKTADNRLVFGSRGSDHNDPDMSDRRRMVSRLRAVFPQFPDLNIEYLWSGRIAFTLDHLPHVHELAPGLNAGLGCNGRGVAMATAMGKQLASWVLSRESKDLAIPVTPLRTVPFHRFHRIGLRTAVWWKTLCDRIEARNP